MLCHHKYRVPASSSRLPDSSCRAGIQIHWWRVVTEAPYCEWVHRLLHYIGPSMRYMLSTVYILCLCLGVKSLWQVIKLFLYTCVCLQGKAATGYLAQHQLFDQVMFCFCYLAHPGHVHSVHVYIHISKYMKLKK